jgi:hypothetical protein
MVWDNEQSVRTLAIDVWKVLLKLRVPALEEILISHGMQVHSFLLFVFVPQQTQVEQGFKRIQKEAFVLEFHFLLLLLFISCVCQWIIMFAN